jgi:hypothetical protein
VGFPHVRVGHRQALILKTLIGPPIRVFFRLEKSKTTDLLGFFPCDFTNLNDLSGLLANLRERICVLMQSNYVN